LTRAGSPLDSAASPLGAVGAAHEIVPLLASVTTEASDPNDPFVVPSAQSTPDCQPPRSDSSRRRKLKIAPT